jgi:TIR domain
MSDIFVSYASDDRPRAEELARAFEKAGWSVFWDRAIPAGKSWRETIGRELEECRCVVVLWSRASIQSSWVQDEAEDARRRRVLVPILIDNVVPPIGFRGLQAADLSNWTPGASIPASTRLIADIAAVVGSPARAATEGPRLVEQTFKTGAGSPKRAIWATALAGLAGIVVAIGLLASYPPWRSAWLDKLFSTSGPDISAANGASATRPAEAPPPSGFDDVAVDASSGQNSESSLTELALRMKNEPSVTSAVIGATKVLAAADKTPEFFEQGCDKDPAVGNFYRGMLLAHAGYYLVLSELQTGSYKRYGFPPKDYSLLDKDSLYAFWTKDRIAKVWRDSNALGALGADDRKALVAFLSELQAFRSVYALVKRAKPDLDSMNWGFGPPIPAEEVSEILRRAGRPPISKCYESDYGYKLSWNVTANGSTEIAFEPINYMIGFWHRRDAEGKSDLADWFLSSMVSWLKL